MATISKSADAPADLGAATFGNTVVDVSSGSVETDDPNVIAEAQKHPWFDVEVPVVEADETPEDYDPNDPHDNPSSDHLSVSGSDSARAAAEANEAALKEVTTGQTYVPPTDNPTVAESLAETFDTVGVESEPTLPEPETASKPDEPPVVDPPVDPSVDNFDNEGGF